MGALRLWTTRELYPPETPDAIKAALMALRGEKDLEGRALLRRSFSQSERDALRARSRALDPWISKPREGEIEPLLLELSLGLQNRGESEEESAIRVSHYAEILADTPLWAIKRACDRFDRGEVTAEELGERLPLMRGRFPSTAHLYRVASALSRPVFHERIRIHDALNGVVARNGPASEEDKSDVAATLARFKRAVGGESVLEEAKRAITKADVARATAEAAERIRVDEFYAAGVDPPEVKPGGIPVSLSTLLRLGYRIIEHPESGKTLVAPQRRSA